MLGNVNFYSPTFSAILQLRGTPVALRVPLNALIPLNNAATVILPSTSAYFIRAAHLCKHTVLR
jgi:hypothetical protein